MILSAEEFARLRSSEDEADYGRASSEEAPIEVWFSVVERFPDLREWVAHNKTVPLAVLARLANDPSAKVRATVAGKRKLTRELQEHLAKDADPSVRHRLAWNAKCPLDVLHLLASDTESFVREAAEGRLRVRGDAL